MNLKECLKKVWDALINQFEPWIKFPETKKDKNVKRFTLAGPAFSSPGVGLVLKIGKGPIKKLEYV